MDKQRKSRDKSLATVVVGSALAASAALAQAMSFELGDDSEWTLDWDTNVAYTAQFRVAKPDGDQFRYKDTGNIEADSRAYAVLINANDGDNNFKPDAEQGVLRNRDGSQARRLWPVCQGARLLRRRVRPEHAAG
jgi:hypothetical protein